MSGFITIYHTEKKPVQEKILSKLVHSLQHRGPDRQDMHIDGSLGMGHTLFRTTFEADYDTQPATLDDNVWITSSARIDDRKNLINKLGKRGEIALDKTPDHELILHAYNKWGEDCLEHLLGDFAFVIWDAKEKKIFCAKDRFGMRQLYYSYKNGELVLGNSLHTMLQYPGISSEISDDAVAGFLLFGSYTWLDKSLTIAKDIRSLLPAHKMVFKNGKITISRYWDLPMDLPLLQYQKRSDYLDHFRNIFKTAVKDRLRTPSVAISMSGGMDSSAVAAMVHQLQEENRPTRLKVQAVTSVFDHLFNSKERHYAGIVAKHLDIPIHYVPGDDASFIRPMILTTNPMEDYLPEYWLNFSKTASSYSRVLLTGMSGDNLIYPSPAIYTMKEINPLKTMLEMYRLKKLYGKSPSIGSGIRTWIKKKTGKETSSFSYPYPDWLNPEFEERLQLKKIWAEYLHQEQEYKHPRHPFAYNILTNSDWNSDDIYMKSGFTPAEQRDPFLDLRLIEFLYALPSIPWFFKKHILRESMRGILPDTIIDRPKTVLGSMYPELLHQPDSRWIDSWKDSPLLTKYIIKEKIPHLYATNMDEESQYISLRPVILNEWFKKFSNTYVVIS